jgi:hypothetical protein
MQFGSTPVTSATIAAALGLSIAPTTDASGNVGLGLSANAAVLAGGGTGNISIGIRANRNVTTGTDNIAIGSETLRTLVSGTFNIAIGNSALFNLGSTANNNIAIGQQAGLNMTSGAGNVLIGQQAGTNMVSNAGVNETASSVMIGFGAGKWFGSTGDGGDVIIGYGAGGFAFGTTVNATAYRIVAIGRSALANLSQGVHNTAVGDAAGEFTTVGGSNAFFGRGSGNKNTTGGFNTMVGHAAGTQFTTGGSNTFVGDQAGNAGAAATPRTGSFNTAIGDTCGTLGAADSNSITIGASAVVSGSNLTVIGLGQTAAYISGRLSHTITDSAVNNAAGQTYTAAQFLGGVISRSGATTVSDTTPTAAAIVAAIPGCEVGSATYLDIINTNSGLLTILAGSGVTLSGTTTIATVNTRRYAIIVTNATLSSEAVTMRGLSAGAN